MAKRKFRVRKGSIKSILLAVLVGALILGSVSGIVAIFNRDTTTVSTFLSFDLGSLDENGFFVESNTSIYTKDLIECKGLTIEPDFEAKGTFQVFYYGEDKAFIGATEVLNAAYGVYTRGDDFGRAVYCRIMITPEVPTDDEGNQVEDYKIRFWNVLSIANDYTITVDKDQTADEFADLFVADPSMKGKILYWEAADQQPYETTADGFGMTKSIDVSDLDKLTIEFKGQGYEVGYFFYNADDACVDHGSVSASGEIVIPQGAQSFKISYKLGQEFRIIAA